MGTQRRPQPAAGGQRTIEVTNTTEETQFIVSLGNLSENPPLGEVEPVVPEIVDGHVVWPKGEARTIARDYTPVHYDQPAGTLELHVVLHGSGHASSWAKGARVGNVLAVAGPRGSHVPQRRPHRLPADAMLGLSAAHANCKHAPNKSILLREPCHAHAQSPRGASVEPA